MRRGSAAALLLVFLFFASVYAEGSLQFPVVGTAETGTFGCPIVGSMNWTFGRYKDASRFWLSAEGTVQSITVYFASLGFSAKAAVYADFNGTPGILVVQSSNQSVGEVGGQLLRFRIRRLFPDITGSA